MSKDKTPLESVDDPIHSEQCAKLLGALAAPERLRIVGFLRSGEKTVSEIAEELQAPLVNVSHHLTVLRHAQLVETERRGRFIYYSLPASLFSPTASTVKNDQLDLGCCRLQIPKEE